VNGLYSEKFHLLIKEDNFIDLSNFKGYLNLTYYLTKLPLCLLLFELLYQLIPFIDIFWEQRNHIDQYEISTSLIIWTEFCTEVMRAYPSEDLSYLLFLVNFIESNENFSINIDDWDNWDNSGSQNSKKFLSLGSILIKDYNCLSDIFTKKT